MAYSKNRLIHAYLKACLLISFFFAVLLFNHLNLVIKDPILDYDDNIVVVPMGKVTTLNDYLFKIKAGEILDVQPVRDFSLWIDHQFKKYFSVSIHHFHNLVIWLMISVLLFYILVSQNISRYVAAITVLLYAFHPCLANALCWASARKHLLSTFFILTATLWITKIFKSKNIDSHHNLSILSTIGISFLYLLACFSHPINIGWPIWAISYYYISCLNVNKEHCRIFFKNSSSKRLGTFFIILFIILICTLLINLQYYSSSISGWGYRYIKYVTPENNQLSFKILALGAAFFQILVPLWPTPSSYYPGSFRNLAGLVMLVFFLFAVFKIKEKENRRMMIAWGIFALLPILVVTANMTNIFLCDTYILIPAAGIYVIISSFIIKNNIFKSLSDSSWHSAKHYSIYFTSILAGVLLLSFIYSSHQVSQSWRSDKEVWLFAQKNEETPTVIKNLAAIYLNERQYEISFQLSFRLLEWDPFLEGADFLYAKSLYNNMSVGVTEKISLFKKGQVQRPDSVWMKYFFSLFYADSRNWLLAYQYFQAIPFVDFRYFAREISLIAADYVYICLKRESAKVNSCHLIAIQLESMNKNIWNETMYKNRLQQLQME